MKQKSFFQVSQVLSFRHGKQISKNVVGTTLKATAVYLYWELKKIFCITCLFLLLFLVTRKIKFKISQDLYFYPVIIIEFFWFA